MFIVWFGLQNGRQLRKYKYLKVAFLILLVEIIKTILTIETYKQRLPYLIFFFVHLYDH